MAGKNVWHEDDAFWDELEPFVFDADRWARTAGEVDQLLKLTELKPTAKVCDVGCGPGRVSLELSRRGFQVTGIDRTASYLSRARQQAGEEGLDITFLQEDMRNFVLPKTFDCALSMYTTFGYFEDPAENLQVLDNIYNSLREGGILVIEVMGKEILARIFTVRNWDQNGETFLLQERRVNKDWSWIQNRWILIDGLSQVEYETSHWVYSAIELKQMLQGAGFSAVSFFGSLAGQPYDHEAQRMIAIAYKE